MLESLLKSVLPPCSYHRLALVSEGYKLNSVSLSFAAMPGDPAVVDGAKIVPTTLSATDLLMAFTMKLPPFWPDNIETWFIQSESQFCLKEVTCIQTKFDYVVQAMSQSDTVKVLDFI